MKPAVFSSGAAWSRRAAAAAALARSARRQACRFAGSTLDDGFWTTRVDDALGMYNAARCAAAARRRLDTLFEGI